jgi:hypothetical protein
MCKASTIYFTERVLSFAPHLEFIYCKGRMKLPLKPDGQPDGQEK